MANKVFYKAKLAILQKLHDVVGDVVKAQLIDTGAYTVNITTHEFLSDVPGGARIGSPVTLTGKELAAAVSSAERAAWKSNPIVFSGVSSAEDIEAMILYFEAATDGERRLLLYVDTADGEPGLPFLPQGNQITATCDPDEGWIRF